MKMYTIYYPDSRSFNLILFALFYFSCHRGVFSDPIFLVGRLEIEILSYNLMAYELASIGTIKIAIATE